jgi:hypothetical protein
VSSSRSLRSSEYRGAHGSERRRAPGRRPKISRVFALVHASNVDFRAHLSRLCSCRGSTPRCSIGRNIKQLIDRPDEPYCFRLHKDRVYYVR